MIKRAFIFPRLPSQDWPLIMPLLPFDLRFWLDVGDWNHHLFDSCVLVCNKIFTPDDWSISDISDVVVLLCILIRLKKGIRTVCLDCQSFTLINGKLRWLGEISCADYIMYSYIWVRTTGNMGESLNRVCLLSSSVSVLIFFPTLSIQPHFLRPAFQGALPSFHPTLDRETDVMNRWYRMPHPSSWQEQRSKRDTEVQFLGCLVPRQLCSRWTAKKLTLYQENEEEEE